MRMGKSFCFIYVRINEMAVIEVLYQFIRLKYNIFTIFAYHEGKRLLRVLLK